LRKINGVNNPLDKAFIDEAIAEGSRLSQVIENTGMLRAAQHDTHGIFSYCDTAFWGEGEEDINQE
jgi:hypothetical protein